MTENNVIYNIYSIRSYNNDKLVFYNFTKRKKISDILSSYKTRYKRFQNNKDNWLNVFYLLEQDKTYIKIEEQLTNSNDEMIKSLLCDYIAKNNCINKLNVDEINKLCNKEAETEKENQLVIYQEPKKSKEEPKKEIKEEIINTINELKKDKEMKLIEEPKEEPKEEIINTINEPKKDKEIKLTKLYNDDYLYNDKNFEPSKDEEKINTINDIKNEKENEKDIIIKKLEDIKILDDVIENIESSTSSISSSTSSNNDNTNNIKKSKTIKNIKDKNVKKITLKNIRY